MKNKADTRRWSDWRDSSDDPPDACSSPWNRVLVASNAGGRRKNLRVEISLADYVREMPRDYPYWMPLPEVPE